MFSKMAAVKNAFFALLLNLDFIKNEFRAVIALADAILNEIASTDNKK